MLLSRILGLLALFVIHAFSETTSHKSTFDAPASFKEANDMTDLVISDGKKSFTFTWAYQDKDGRQMGYPCELKEGETYTFTLDEERTPYEAKYAPQSKPEDRVIKRTHLSKITQAGKVIFDREMCEVHQRRMDRKEVAIIFGLVGPATGKQPTNKELKTLFPHHSEKVFGGCIMGPVTTEVKYVCPDCKIAHEKWAKENGSK
jgi:hypothetical protein